MKQLTIALMALVYLSSCNSAENDESFKTSTFDYVQYLTESEDLQSKDLLIERDFWSDKLFKAPDQWTYLVKLSGLNSALFDRSGDVNYLFLAEKNLEEANVATFGKNCGILRSLAKNCISQHKFLEAKQLLLQADSIGEGKPATNNMLFDVYMELGEYKQAEERLAKIEVDNFNFYIRLAKWLDHKGKLPEAIEAMESAKNLAEKMKDDDLRLWSYSNLADFYGHAGRLEESYKHYLKTLGLDPHYTYALKGIAWIVFSKERNTEQAYKITQFVEQHGASPDIYLLQAQIAQYEGNKALEETKIEAYQQSLQKVNYGRMYNTYNVELWSERKDYAKEAVILAQDELQHRSTPEIYGLLAWAQLSDGQITKALETIEAHVLHQTHEPKPLYFAAEVLKANGKTNEARLLKAELLEASFELGPNYTTKIEGI